MLLKKSFYWLELIVMALLATTLLFMPFGWVKKWVLQKSFKEENTKTVTTLFLLKLSEDIPKLERFFPWQYRCYQQALTARLLLNNRRQANILSLGNKMKDDGVAFHAWSSCRGLVITGFPDVEEYHLIHCFD
jgi:hypothetical protein